MASRSFLAALALVAFFEGAAASVEVEGPGGLRELAAVLRAKMEANSALAPGLVRLAFHDCVGGCDGCVNVTHPDNGGLATYINELSDITIPAGMSMGDLIAFAGMEAAKFSAGCDFDGLIPSTFVRTRPRQTTPAPQFCPSEGSTFRVGRNTPADCSTLPARHFPSADLRRDELQTFFDNEFSFNVAETVCIMGAHSLGRARPENSGYSGPWTQSETSLSNRYYIDLVRAWRPQSVVTNGIRLWQWARGQGDGQTMMLNADMTMAWDFDIQQGGQRAGRQINDVLTQTGEFHDQVIQYTNRQANNQWLLCFFHAFKKMTETVPEGVTLGDVIDW